ncbi:Maltose permease MAL31 [Exophiala dermatitidis]
MKYDSVPGSPASQSSMKDRGENIPLADLSLQASARYEAEHDPEMSLDYGDGTHIENDDAVHLLHSIHDGKPEDDGPLDEAHVQFDENKLTVRESIRAYPMAIFWCLAVSMCVIMEGYDAILVSNLFAFPSFQRKYGTFVGVTEQTQSGYQLSPAWMAAVGNASGVGAFFGTLLNGHLVSQYGQKHVLIGSLVLLSSFIVLTFFAPTIEVLFLGQILCGFPWGVFATTAPGYASEVLPMSLRVYFTSWTNMCFIIGQLLAAGVLRACLGLNGEWGFRLPFAGQWVWPVFLIPLLCFAPESPWHLVRQGRHDEAEWSLRRLRSNHRINHDNHHGNHDTSDSSDAVIKQTLASIIHTNKLEESLSVGTSYADCFRGFELRRTEIACVCFAGQILAGSSFAYNASYFFEQVGLSPQTTYTLNLAGTGLALAGTVMNWICVMPYFGRRTIYIVGMLAMSLELFAIGVLNFFADADTNTTASATADAGAAAGEVSRVSVVSLIQASLTLIWTITFQLSVGQLGWSLPAEIGSTRLRQKTICLARNAYYIASVVAGIVQPYLMNPKALNARGFAGFVWGTTAWWGFMWALRRLPETKGRSFEELDVLFARGVPAMGFEDADVRALEEEDRGWESDDEHG